MLDKSKLPQDILTSLPVGLPKPSDDSLCNHLVGLPLPFIVLPATSGKQVELASQAGRIVIYCYPMTGRPGRAVPQGWAAIPGAAGCTPQACGFRDSHDAFTALGVGVFGLSAQSTEDQKEAAERLKLPYELLSDHQLSFAQALNLPTFEVDGKRLIKRLTLVAKNGMIEKYFYPVFPPDRNAEEVLSWLRIHAV
jgi:peroxiredoxin